MIMQAVRSLRVRFAFAGVATAVVLAGLLGLSLQPVFERHVERAALDELHADLRFLTKGLTVTDGRARLVIDPLPDPRFLEPESGLYWQVSNDADGSVIRSPSLGEFSIPLAADDLPIGVVHRHVEIGPSGTKLIVLEKRFSGGAPDRAGYRFAVAIDRRVIQAGYASMISDILPILAAAFVVLLAASVAQALIVLSPIGKARRALADVRAGRRERLDAALPTELQDLAEDFDHLLATQRKRLQRAKSRAAELAHGLKTPLALLSAKARELAEQGRSDVARDIEDVVQMLDSRVTRELARARIHGPSGATRPSTLLAPVAARVAGALGALGETRGVRWTLDVGEEFAAPLDTHDLTELVGALAENAAKWAKSAVRIAASGAGSSWMLVVEDDGPGIPAEQRARAFERGLGLDPERSGSGLGLAIAQDIAAAYSGLVELDASPLGGLRVTVAFTDGA